MPTPSEQLQRLRVVLEAGIPVPADLSAWLLAGLERFETQDDPERIRPLCKILGLRPEGRQSIRYQRRLQKRNQALREAIELIPGDTTRQRCGRLLEEIKRYQRRPVAKADPLRESIQRASQAHDVPQSIPGLLKALEDETKPPTV